MLIFLDHIINSPLQPEVIYFDISKAFDTVSYSILLNKLWSVGITGVLWTWFKVVLKEIIGYSNYSLAVMAMEYSFFFLKPHT